MQMAPPPLGDVELDYLRNRYREQFQQAFVAAVTSLPNSRRFCQVVGVVLLLLGVLGVFVANPLGLLYIGQLDIPLHLVSGAVLAYFGFAATVSTRSA